MLERFALIDRMMNDKNKRWDALGCFLGLLAVEILIGRFAHGFVRAYIGDVLVIPLIYCFVRIFYVRRCVWLPAAAGGPGILAEALQYADVCGRLGIPKGSLLGILLGSSADLRDVICYAAGVGMIYAAEGLYAAIVGRGKLCWIHSKI